MLSAFAQIVDFIKFEAGNLVMLTGGRNMGRSGVIVHRERHLGGFDIGEISTLLYGLVACY